MRFPQYWILVAVALCGCSHSRHSTIGDTSPTVELGTDSGRPLKAGERLEMRASCNAYAGVIIVLDSEGDATFPFIGKIRLAGLSLLDAERKVERLYVDQGYYRHLDLRFARF